VVHVCQEFTFRTARRFGGLLGIVQHRLDALARHGCFQHVGDRAQKVELVLAEGPRLPP
jgi:hypothetical protein